MKMGIILWMSGCAVNVDTQKVEEFGLAITVELVATRIKEIIWGCRGISASHYKDERWFKSLEDFFLLQ
jgi:hypothetical protein